MVAGRPPVRAAALAPRRTRWSRPRSRAARAYLGGRHREFAPAENSISQGLSESGWVRAPRIPTSPITGTTRTPGGKVGGVIGATPGVKGVPEPGKPGLDKPGLDKLA